MLNTVFLTDETIEKTTPCILLLGGFDGVHIGHAELVSRAKTYGLPIGITTIVGVKEGNLFLLSEREQAFKNHGIDFAVEMNFDEIKALSPERFLAELTSRFHVKKFVCGSDFRFGCGAAGTPSDIERLCGVPVDEQALLTVDGEKVSARTIKRLLATGDVSSAAKLLGKAYFVAGRVENGRKIGRTIGFATANVEYPKDKYPVKEGVYETLVHYAGKAYKGITNFGERPTFSDKAVWLETHLDGFEGDLYGKEITVEFIRYLRGVRPFENAEELKEQLQEDLRRVRAND